MADQDVPPWLRASLADAPQQRDVRVDAVNIRYYLWGKPAATPVVLVHGGLSHAHWWDHVAPLLPGRQVIAVDLSGHGDSGSRASYNARQWAREIVAVAVDAGLTRPVVVGHSMGGQAAVATAAGFPDVVSGVITLDTRFNDQAYPHRDKPSRVFASIEDGIRDFNPVHATLEPAAPPTLLQHLAESSLGRAGEGWRWKRDDRYHIDHIPLRDLLLHLRSPLAVVRTEHGLVTAEMAAQMRDLTEGPVVDVEIPAAGHNPMLEQPLALVSVLRTLLTAWFPAVITDGALDATR